MEKEFIPYEQALALKELGFNESCWCYFMGDVFNSSMFPKDYEYLSTLNQKYITYTLAPLYQQAFRWFRENYNIEVSIICHRYTSKKFYQGTIDNIDDNHSYGFGKSLTYEEAELECLKKLIEIVKNK